jgi:NADH-ubiquinone oxidoreductase chain 6
MTKFLLNIFAFGIVFSSLLVITSTNPVIAVIFLISVFLNAAGYLISLGVGFIGLAYVVLYVGAITVLFLFVIMMINIKLTDILETGNQYTKNFPLAVAIGSLFIFEILILIPNPSYSENISYLFFNAIDSVNNLFLIVDYSSLIKVLVLVNPSVADITISNFLQIQAIGHNLYTYGAPLLIICSVLLLLAMVAPIFISRKSKNNK